MEMKQRMSPCETWFKASQQYGKLKVVMPRVRDLMQAAFISRKKKKKKKREMMESWEQRCGNR